MPEGPEIRRVADQLETAIVGQPLTDVWFAFPELKTYEPSLLGEQVQAIETRGKALLTHFSNGLTLYSHNQLYGVWRIVLPESQPETKRQLRVRLATAEQAILLYSASDIELLNADTLASHPFLNRIGPDVLDSTLTVEEVKQRLLSPRFSRRQFSGLLLDQAFLAGLGNYLRVEILWLAELLPQHRAHSLSEAQLTAFSEALLSVPRHAYRMRGTMKKYHSEAAFRFEVFHRQGKKCRRCGTLIEKGTLSSRPFYWCPGCQV
ncbi:MULTISPECIES: endonuclease VIII [unclassified Pantoea]|uniref:endonuclease VIII n=1 Tax=unclassified Pantoea TaxID=2630326 RepID=UPI001FAA8986|nr:endonuclease VIII [Pantoea sp. MQR6]